MNARLLDGLAELQAHVLEVQAWLGGFEACEREPVWVYAVRRHMDRIEAAAQALEALAYQGAQP